MYPETFALSDHDAVMTSITTQPHTKQPRHTYPHNPSKVKLLGHVIPPLPTNAHPWDSLTRHAAHIREPYPRQKFQESRQLKNHRSKLISGQIPEADRRQHWKLIQAARKRERKKWDHAIAVKAAKGDWNAYQSSMDKPQQALWGHRLISQQNSQHSMTTHFEAIFRQQPEARVNSEFQRMRQLLTARCKQAPYQAITMQELRDIQDKWRRKKATGPDRVSNEALIFFLGHNDTANKLHWALEDALYKARSPIAALQDITILLPKQAPPAQRKDTRPTTLSNTIDRAMAQLLLHRCYDQLMRDPPIHQYARTGRQGSKLMAALRRMTRMARDWGFKLWILRVDIRKAFDAIKQTSVAAMIASKLQDTRP